MQQTRRTERLSLFFLYAPLDVHHSAPSNGTRWKTRMCLHAKDAEWPCSSETCSSDQAWSQKKKDNAASTKIVTLAVTQYLTKNHSKVILDDIRGANGRKKWRWSFSHFDKKEQQWESRLRHTGWCCSVTPEQHKRHIWHESAQQLAFVHER